MWPPALGDFSTDESTGNVLNRNIFEPRPPVIRCNSAIIDSMRTLVGAIRGTKKFGKAKVRAIDALFGDRDVGGEFLGDGRSLEAAGLNRLGAAIGLDAGEEKIGPRTVNDALNAERSGIGIEMDRVSLAVRGKRDRD